jgi:predicted O-methyltransferase YrrM
MVTYPLAHLTQPADQAVVGPIQDDEALLLFALIRVMGLTRILEVGGLEGYSAQNFLSAVGPGGMVYSVDIRPVHPLGPNHIAIQRDAGSICPADVDETPLDLVFFDCHVYDAQMAMFHRLRAAGMITSRTVLALHDTNLHPGPIEPWPFETPAETYEIAPGQWVHQKVERQMVNDFKIMGYDVLNLDTEISAHGRHLPYRHGLSIARIFKSLRV